MEIAELKRRELERKLDSLKQEFVSWIAESENEKPLEKHHTQIRRVTAELLTAQERIQLKLSQSDDKLLADSAVIERMILALHRIWDFYRSKLALRAVPSLLPYLVAADELAWDCYHPAVALYKKFKIAEPAALKEPPLVFLNATSSPFTVARSCMYEQELGMVRAESNLNVSWFVDVLKALPIPIIGVPWYQVAHLPDALVICHEVGHLVEADCKLGKVLDERLAVAMQRAKAPPERHSAWKAWRKELFADLYGTLGGGPAFVLALMGFLAASPAAVQTEARVAPNWGAYPTSYLRILLCIEALRQMGYDAQNQPLLAEGPAALLLRWRKTYPQHAMQRFENDLTHVVQAIFEGPYAELDNKGLRAALDFSLKTHDSASQEANRLLADTLQAGAFAVRTRLATAALAFDRQPAEYAEQGIAEKVLGLITAEREVGFRGIGANKPAASTAPPVLRSSAPEPVPSAATLAFNELFDQIEKSPS